jgi:hypothetical protein
MLKPKAMKKFTSLLVLITIGGSVAFGQHGRGARMDESPKQKVQQLNLAVNLTEDQQDDLLIIFTDAKNKAEDIESRLSKGTRGQVLENLQTETYQRVKMILTEEQVARLRAKEEEISNQRRGSR